MLRTRKESPRFSAPSTLIPRNPSGSQAGDGDERNLEIFGVVGGPQLLAIYCLAPVGPQPGDNLTIRSALPKYLFGDWGSRLDASDGMDSLKRNVPGTLRVALT